MNVVGPPNPMQQDLFDSLRAAYHRLLNIPHGATPLSDEEKLALINLFRMETLPRGEFFVRAGEHAPNLAFLLNGLVRYYALRSDGDDISLDFVEEYGIVGDYESLLLDRPASQYVQALEPCQLLIVRYADLLTAYEQHPRLERLGREFMSQYLAGVLRRLTDYMRQTPEERYRHLLTERPSLLQRVPQLLLASYVGVTPVSLSRIRARMARSGRGS